MRVKYIMAIFVVMGITACTNHTPQIQDTVLTDSLQTPKAKLKQAFHQFPTPDEILYLIHSKNVEFNVKLLYPLDKHESFLDSKSQQILLGFYIADLAYITLYGRSKESGEYFDAIRLMCNKLNLNSIYQEDFVKRLERNLNNIDSLQKMYNKSYDKLVKYFEETGTEATLATVAAGIFIESMYISLNILDKIGKNGMVMQRFADQKFTYNNLIEYISAYSDAPNNKMIKRDFAKLSAIFSKFKESEKDKTQVRMIEGKIVLSGGKAIIIDEQLLMELRQEIFILRNNYLNNF